MYKKILAAYDGSDGSKAALDRAFTVAKEYDAPMTMVWVRGSMPHYAKRSVKWRKKRGRRRIFQ